MNTTTWSIPSRHPGVTVECSITDNNRARAIAIIAAKSALGASMALGILVSPAPHANAHPWQCYDRNADGVIDPNPCCGWEGQYWVDRCGDVTVDHGTAAADGAVPGPVPTINLTDVPDIDSLPVCTMEDCSDQPGQVGVWPDTDNGDWYLSRGERSWLIIDNTVTMPGAAYLGPETAATPRDDVATGPNSTDLGAYVGGWN